MESEHLFYSVKSGVLSLAAGKAGRTFVCRGYSGFPPFVNRPAFESLKALGPIPGGLWRMGSAIHHQRLGPVAIPLYPEGHSAHGRSGFYIHGDNRRGGRTSSTGCIVLPRWCRDWIVRKQRAIPGLVLYVYGDDDSGVSGAAPPAKTLPHAVPSGVIPLAA